MTTPRVARPGEIQFRDRCPADGQRIRFRVRKRQNWEPERAVWDASGSRAMVCQPDGTLVGRSIVMARLTAWLPA